MAVPKRRHSKRRKNLRRANSYRLTRALSHTCSNCGEPKLPHRICGNCGFYRGEQVLETELD